MVGGGGVEVGRGGVGVEVGAGVGWMVVPGTVVCARACDGKMREGEGVHQCKTAETWGFVAEIRPLHRQPTCKSKREKGSAYGTVMRRLFGMDREKDSELSGSTRTYGR